MKDHDIMDIQPTSLLYTEKIMAQRGQIQTQVLVRNKAAMMLLTLKLPQVDLIRSIRIDNIARNLSVRILNLWLQFVFHLYYNITDIRQLYIDHFILYTWACIRGIAIGDGVSIAIEDLKWKYMWYDCNSDMKKLNFWWSNRIPSSSSKILISS